MRVKIQINLSKEDYEKYKIRRELEKSITHILTDISSYLKIEED